MTGRERIATRGRGTGSNRRQPWGDVLVDELGNTLVDEGGTALEAGFPITTRALNDERGLLLIDESGFALIAP